MASSTSPMKGNERQSNFGQCISDAAEQAKNAPSSLGEKAKDAASSVANKAEDAASYIGHAAEGATSAVGGGLKSLGQTLKEKTPQTGMVHDASTAVSRTLEDTGRYLQEEGLQGIADDLTKLVTRNPIPALLVGVGIGYLIARAMSPRS